MLVISKGSCTSIILELHLCSLLVTLITDSDCVCICDASPKWPLFLSIHIQISASHSFPYVKKRILVVYHKEEELSPIEVAIDEMKNRVVELDDVVSQRVPDLKRLQLKLQGCVSTQVCITVALLPSSLSSYALYAKKNIDSWSFMHDYS